MAYSLGAEGCSSARKHERTTAYAQEWEAVLEREIKHILVVDERSGQLLKRPT
jgi:hypothetical protein